jgi:hypothetical protein
MTTPIRAAAAVAIGVLAVGGALFVLRPSDASVSGPGPAPSPTPTPTASPSLAATPATSPAPDPTPISLIEADDLPLAPGTYVTSPFSQPGSDWCFVMDRPPFASTPPSGCTDTKSDDSIRITFDVPAGWATIGGGVWPQAENSGSPDGASLIFSRGAWLHSDPCKGDELEATGFPPDIAVGPTVDDFANVIADHPLLDATTPVDVSLGGYSGKYVDLQLPADLDCVAYYFPWEPGIYAQGPSNRWHLWILDVDGIRVVVQSTDYAGTSPQRQSELRAMVESIQIES